MTAPSHSPAGLAELTQRALALTGRSLEELGQQTGTSLSGPHLRRKGKTGLVIERVLGASAGSASLPDFPHLGVELKTLPIDERRRPRESTFVCSFSLADADRAEWASSAVRAKLSHVLFVPISNEPSPRVGRPFFWRPSREEEEQLAADFDDIMGLVAIGKIEQLDARIGALLQARPKAAHGKVRTRAYGFDGEPIAALPRGFYLRSRFTAELLARADRHG